MGIRIALLALIILLAAVQPALGLSRASFMALDRYRISPALIAALDSRIAVYDPARSILAFIDPSSGEVLEVNAPAGLSAIESANGVVYGISAVEPRLYAFTASGSRWVELPDVARSLYASEEHVWVCIPDRGLVLGFDAGSLSEVFRFEAQCAAGRQAISESGGLLWILSSDHATLLRIDLETGGRAERRFDEVVAAVSSLGQSCFVALGDDRVLRLDRDLRILDSWSLPSESSIDIFIHPLEDRRLVYVAYARWRVGELDGGALTETSTNGTAEYASPGRDRIWFILPNKGEVGWAYYSRPPVVSSFRVERVAGGFRAVAEVHDPDGDLSTVKLVLRRPQPVEGAPPRIEEVEMSREGGVWVAVFQLEPGGRVYAYVEALDAVGNLGRSGEVEVSGGALEATTSVAATSSTLASIPASELYLAGSSLLLLIPIVFAILLSRRKRGRRRR